MYLMSYFSGASHSVIHTDMWIEIYWKERHQRRFPDNCWCGKLGHDSSHTGRRWVTCLSNMTIESQPSRIQSDLDILKLGNQLTLFPCHDRIGRLRNSIGSSGKGGSHGGFRCSLSLQFGTLSNRAEKHWSWHSIHVRTCQWYGSSICRRSNG